ncbi:MAG: hypothetical protein SynsKO_14730 [Synoicihabitans sp.]
MVSLLVDQAELIEIRPTDDVDVVIEVLSHSDYTKLEQRLRGVGFANDFRVGAPRCRWVLGNLTVDIMPTRGELQGLNTAWFQEALESAIEIPVQGARLTVVSAVGFLATKYAAFEDRGKGDYYGSADVEDMITVIDGREEITREITDSDPALCRFVVESIKTLNEDPDFQDALSGLLPSDEAGQARLPALRAKLQQIAGLR